MTTATKPEDIWVLSVLDKLMNENKESKEIFKKLFERKKDLLNLIQSFKIDAPKYKKILVKAFKNGDEVTKQCASQDCSKLQGNGKDPELLNEWFKKMIDQTGQFFEQQQMLYNKFCQNTQSRLAPVSALKSSIHESGIRKSAKRSEIKGMAGSKGAAEQHSFKELVSLKAAEDMLFKYEDKYEIYKQILDKKIKLIHSIEDKSLSAEDYKKSLEKALPYIKNEDIEFSTQMEYDGLADFHDNNAETWLKETLDEVKGTVNNQKRLLQKISPEGVSGKEKPPHIPKGPKKMDQTQEPVSNNSMKKGVSVIKPPSQIKSTKKSVIKVEDKSIKPNELTSFKALEELKAEMNSQVTERKKQLLQDKRKGILTAKRYKEEIQKNYQNISNEELKECIKLQLDLLQDLHDGNEEAWFADVIEEAEGLELLGEEIKHTHSEAVKTESVKNSQHQSSLHQNKLNVKEILNLKALDQYLQQSKEQKDIYCQLFEKKLSIFEDMKTGKITAKKYLAIQKKLLEITENEKLRDIVDMNVSELTDIYDGNLEEWFKSLIDETGLDFDEQQMTYERFKKDTSSVTKSKGQQQEKNMKTETVNERNASNIKTSGSKPSTIHIFRTQGEKRIEFFLKEMSRYESLFYYHKKNKIPFDQNKYLVEYEKKMKKSVHDYIKQIETNKKLDVFKMTDKLFPHITEQIFYGDQFQFLKTCNFPLYQEKTKKLISCFQKQQVSLKEYMSKLKKSTNFQNIKQSTQEISECAENINYLNRWPTQKYEPFPVFTEERVQKFNMDENKLDANEVEIIINDIQGLQQEALLRVFIASTNPCFDKEISNNASNIRVVGKVGEEEKVELMRGKQKHIKLVLLEKKFFGGPNILGQALVQTFFTRNNTTEQKVQIGHAIFSLTIRVKMAYNPIITDITQYTLTKIPAYQHSFFVEEELKKKYMIYSNPTPSEIH